MQKGIKGKKTDKMTSPNLKFLYFKGHHWKNEKTTQNGKKYLQIIWLWTYIKKIYTELLHNSVRQIIQFNNGQWISTGISPQKTYKWLTSTWKDTQHGQHWFLSEMHY